MAEGSVTAAGGPVPYAATVPGRHRATSGDLGGAPYGRTECGRPRGRAVGIPGKGKGLSKITSQNIIWIDT